MEMGPGRAQVCASASGAVESPERAAEQVTPGSRALGNFYKGDSLAVFSLLFFLPAAPCFSFLSSLVDKNDMLDFCTSLIID